MSKALDKYGQASNILMLQSFVCSVFLLRQIKLFSKIHLCRIKGLVHCIPRIFFHCSHRVSVEQISLLEFWFLRNHLFYTYLLSSLCTTHARLIPYKLFRYIKLIFRHLCPVWNRKQLFLELCGGVKNSLSSGVPENSYWAKSSSILNLQNCWEKAGFLMAMRLSAAALLVASSQCTKWDLIKDHEFEVIANKKLIISFRKSWSFQCHLMMP